MRLHKSQVRDNRQKDWGKFEPTCSDYQLCTGAILTEAQIKYMVDRFLCWKLPETFNPDNGISFDPTYNGFDMKPIKRDPVGTNLFSATEADAMVRNMIEGMMP